MRISNHTGITSGQWLNREIFQKKLLSPVGLVLLAALAAFCGMLAAFDLYIVPFAFGMALIGIIFIYACFFKPLMGMYLVTAFAFFMFYPSHLIGFEISFNPLVEMLIIFLLCGTLLQAKRSRVKTNLSRTIMSIALICYVLYFIVQAFNPHVAGLSGWHTPFRRLLALCAIYYISYFLIDTPEKLKYYFNFWIVFSFIAALYGCYQQWFGYLPMELRYIRSIPAAYELLFQGGQLRKFSFLSDVVSFGILSGAMAVFCLLWGINETRKTRKYLLFFASIMMLLGMAYSGTRTTNILLPAGIAMYAIVTIQNKLTLIAVFVCIMAIMFILFAPIHNNLTLNRVRTTFDSKDPSLNIRDRNRKYIQPYIFQHPIGGGLSTTGETGRIKSPGHALAGFPADSYLLRAALEIGWIGLAVSLLVNLCFLYQGIYYYFRMQNPLYRTYIAMMLATLFPVIVTQYSQETVGQLPFAFFFFSCLSLITRVKEFDDKDRLARISKPSSET